MNHPCSARSLPEEGLAICPLPFPLSFSDTAGPCVLGSRSCQEMLAAPGSPRTVTVLAADPSGLLLIWCCLQGPGVLGPLWEGCEAGRDVLSHRSRCQACTLLNRAPEATWLCC